MFKYFCENFLAVFSVQNQKSVQTILRQCKRDWHTRLEPLHPWERRNYPFETEVRDYDLEELQATKTDLISIPDPSRQFKETF